MSRRSDNRRHREQAQTALDAYGRVHADWADEFVDKNDLLTDLLADLRHWARSKRLDFDHASNMAEIHFNEEVQS